VPRSASRRELPLSLERKRREHPFHCCSLRSACNGSFNVLKGVLKEDAGSRSSGLALNYLVKLLRPWCYQSDECNSLEAGSLLAVAYGDGAADEVARVWLVCGVFDLKQLEMVGLVSSLF